jgi:two-component system chemotaxis response regulator CheY
LPKTILVVDDSSITRLVASRALQGAGYEVIEAADGKAALAILDGRSIEMTVCDLSMPNMNGIEFVEAVKNMPRYQFIPVMMLTAAGEVELKEEGKKAGVKAWMTKPFNLKVLVKAVDKLCP